MVSINIKCKSSEEMHELRDKFCLALMGSPAFIDSEIAVCDLQDDAFTLIVGNSNDNNIDLDVNNKYILER